MLIAQKKSPEDVILIEKEIPQIRDGEVLLKVYSCGVCGGDLQSSSAYHLFGHEMTGIVEKVGKLVTTISVGDRVVVESASFCGACEQCKNGRVDLCEHTYGPAFAGFAEYAAVPYQSCVYLPEDISYKLGGIIEPLGVAIDLVKTADIQMGDHVLIYGTGTIGLMALQLAKRRGASKIYAVLRSRAKKKAELALQFGADEIIYSDQVSLKEYSFAKGGVDKAMITAQNSVIPEVLDMLNYGGSATFLGFGGDPMISINANEFHVKKLQLKASFAKPGIYFPMAIEALRTGMVDAEALITHTRPLEEIAELMEIAGVHRDEVVKAVMVAKES